MNANGWGFQSSRTYKNVAVGGAKKSIWIHECKNLAKGVREEEGVRIGRRGFCFILLSFKFLTTESNQVECNLHGV
jgi:hypothetical protein